MEFFSIWVIISSKIPQKVLSIDESGSDWLVNTKAIGWWIRKWLAGEYERDWLVNKVYENGWTDDKSGALRSLQAPTGSHSTNMGYPLSARLFSWKPFVICWYPNILASNYEQMVYVLIVWKRWVPMAPCSSQFVPTLIARAIWLTFDIYPNVVEA